MLVAANAAVALRVETAGSFVNIFGSVVASHLSPPFPDVPRGRLCDRSSGTSVLLESLMHCETANNVDLPSTRARHPGPHLEGSDPNSVSISVHLDFLVVDGVPARSGRSVPP
jgi:hypothetical protein